MKKKMKKVAVMILGFALTGAVLTGCGESRQSRKDIQQSIPANISEETGQDSVSERAETDAAEKAETDAAEKAETGAAEKPAQTSEGYEDNFAVDSKAAKEFAGKIKEATA